jgi:hypothetical protein
VQTGVSVSCQEEDRCWIDLFAGTVLPGGKKARGSLRACRDNEPVRCDCNAICAFPGVKHAVVYGVTIPATDSRAGMATLSTDDELDMDGIRDQVISRLPPYARPLFVSIRKNMDLTGTFKYSNTELIRQGYDPSNYVVWFDNLESGAFIRLDKDLYERIQVGSIRF